MKAKEMLLKNADENIESIKGSISKLEPKIVELKDQLKDWERLRSALEKMPDDFGLEQGE
jgi:phage shock protein A